MERRGGPCPSIAARAASSDRAVFTIRNSPMNSPSMDHPFRLLASWFSAFFAARPVERAAGLPKFRAIPGNSGSQSRLWRPIPPRAALCQPRRSQQSKSRLWRPTRTSSIHHSTFVIGHSNPRRRSAWVDEPTSSPPCLCASCLDPSVPSSHSSDVSSTAMNALCGMVTFPTCFMRFLPSFCFSRSLRFRVTSPP